MVERLAGPMVYSLALGIVTVFGRADVEPSTVWEVAWIRTSRIIGQCSVSTHRNLSRQEKHGFAPSGPFRVGLVWLALELHLR